MEEVLVGLMALVVIGLVISEARKYKTLGDWKVLAQCTGLGYRPGGILSYPSLSGELHGRKVTIDATTSAAPRNSTELVRVRVGLNKTLAGVVHLVPETAGTRFNRAVYGSQDYPVGEERFRETFMIKGSSFGFAEDVLSDTALQEELLGLRQIREFDLVMSEASLAYTTLLETDIDQLEKVLSILDSTAARIEASAAQTIFAAPQGEVVLYPR